MNTLDYIIDKFELKLNRKGGTEIYNINRTIVAQCLEELDFKEGAEVGVAEGHHAQVLCKENPGVKLHCIDPWAMYPGYTYERDTKKVYREAKKRLKSYGVSFYKKLSMDAVKNFKDNSLDFVYIDAAHDFKNVVMDITEWSKKVRVGGIVFGHDYLRTRHSGMHVKDVVPSWMYAHGIKSWFVLKNDIKDPTFGRDRPGWMFVRERKDFRIF